jgi:putative SOS response-associated peptidase YedK
MTNVRNLAVNRWRALAAHPEDRCIAPLTEFCEFTPEKHDLGDGKPPLKGETWFQVKDQPGSRSPASGSARRRVTGSRW